MVRMQSSVAVAVLTVFGLAAQPRVLQIAGEGPKIILLSDGAVFRGAAQRTERVPLPRPAIGVAAGTSVYYALLEDRTVVSWTPTTAPAPVAGIAGAKQIAAMERRAWVLHDDGTVSAFGGDPRARISGLENIVQISAGGDHCLALTAAGRVLSWGSNFYGALGRPPRQERPIPTPGEVEGLTGVAQVVAGGGVSTALKKDGTVWVWGANWNGQFGNGARTDPPGMTHGFELTPQPVAGISNVTSVALGLTGRHTLALLKDGTLRGWGNTDWGQLGTGISGTFLLRPVTPRLTNVQAIFAAGNNSFAVRADGSLWAWGSGGRNEWPFAVNTKLPVPVKIE